MIGDILSFGTTLINKLFPDKEQAAAAQLKLLELQQSGGLQELEIQQRNVDNARHRETEMVKAGHRDYTTPALAIVITLGFFSMLLAICTVHIDPEMKPLADIMLGVLGAQFGAVCNYYFGTSKGSSDKNQLLAANR